MTAPDGFVIGLTLKKLIFLLKKVNSEYLFKLSNFMVVNILFDTLQKITTYLNCQILWLLNILFDTGTKITILNTGVGCCFISLFTRFVLFIIILMNYI
jgi:hypothetical protein